MFVLFSTYRYVFAIKFILHSKMSDIFETRDRAKKNVKLQANMNLPKQFKWSGKDLEGWKEKLSTQLTFAKAILQHGVFLHCRCLQN